MKSSQLILFRILIITQHDTNNFNVFLFEHFILWALKKVMFESISMTIFFYKLIAKAYVCIIADSRKCYIAFIPLIIRGSSKLCLTEKNEKCCLGWVLLCKNETKCFLGNILYTHHSFFGCIVEQTVNSCHIFPSELDNLYCDEIVLLTYTVQLGEYRVFGYFMSTKNEWRL
jgi:hypothetical protein